MDTTQATSAANDAEIERPKHRIEAFSSEWPSGLKGLDDAARDLHPDAGRLLALANSGYVPHFRIDGGPPLFKVSELKRWASANLTTHVEGRALPAPVKVIVPAARVQDHRNVPVSLREIVGLCDITGEVTRSGIYFLCRDNAVLYVGQSVNVAVRVAEHCRRYEFDSVLFLPWPGDDLNRIEAALIRALRPPLNGKSSNGAMLTPVSDKAGDAVLIASIMNPPATETTITEEAAAT
jgi:hypothetical protein